MMIHSVNRDELSRSLLVYCYTLNDSREQRNNKRCDKCTFFKNVLYLIHGRTHQARSDCVGHWRFEHEVTKNFERSDFSAEEIYLAIQAAKILCNDRRTR